jgi:hypothetical protein
VYCKVVQEIEKDTCLVFLLLNNNIVACHGDNAVTLEYKFLLLNNNIVACHGDNAVTLEYNLKLVKSLIGTNLV